MSTENRTAVTAQGNAPGVHPHVARWRQHLKDNNLTDKECRFYTWLAQERIDTLKTLVDLVDKLRQPYNGSRHHDLYLEATNTLNDLEDRGLLPR